MEEDIKRLRAYLNRSEKKSQRIGTHPPIVRNIQHHHSWTMNVEAKWWQWWNLNYLHSVTMIANIIAETHYKRMWHFQRTIDDHTLAIIPKAREKPQVHFDAVIFNVTIFHESRVSNRIENMSFDCFRWTQVKYDWWCKAVGLRPFLRSN